MTNHYHTIIANEEAEWNRVQASQSKAVTQYSSWDDIQVGDHRHLHNDPNFPGWNKDKDEEKKDVEGLDQQAQMQRPQRHGNVLLGEIKLSDK